MKNIRYLVRFIALLVILTLVSIISFVLVSGQETDPGADPEAMEENTFVYLPLLQKYPNTIFGLVTKGGISAANVEVSLNMYNAGVWTQIMNTTTKPDGYYAFAGANSLSPGQKYKVKYQNPGDDETRLWTWETPELTSYTSRSAVNIGNFDIANLELGAPKDNSLVSVPQTFYWTPRPTSPTDSYQFDLFDLYDDDPSFSTSHLGYVNNYTLVNLPSGFLYCIPYFWGLTIHSPDGGFGYPYYIREVLLNSVSPSGIHGCVAESGAPASNIQVNLGRYEGEGWNLIASTTTNSNGYYAFVGMNNLLPGQSYSVTYENPGNDPTRLWIWETRELTGYTAGSSVYIGNFDIANLDLNTPAHLALVTVPRTFSWTPRPASPTDSYEFQLFDYNDSNPAILELLGYASSYNLNSLPSGFLNCITYAWGLTIYGPDGSWGSPYWLNAVTFYPTTPSGIHGCVAENGVPKSGIPVELHRFNTSTEVDEELATTNTNASGYFAFTGRPTLGTNEVYFVKYQNNGAETNRLWNWYTRAIDTYIASSSVHIGDFDIKNVALVAPADGSTVNLPETFSWTPRPGLQADSYEFNLYEVCDPPEDCPYWYTDPQLGYDGDYTLTSLPTNFVFNIEYAWEIWLYSPYDSAYGLSYQAFAVTFSHTAMSTTPSRTITEAQRQRRGLERMLHNRQVRSANQPGLRPVFERPPGQE